MHTYTKYTLHSLFDDKPPPNRELTAALLPMSNRGGWLGIAEDPSTALLAGEHIGTSTRAMTKNIIEFLRENTELDAVVYRELATNSIRSNLGLP